MEGKMITRHTGGMEGRETPGNREDLREKGKEQQKKRGGDREAGEEQHVCSDNVVWKSLIELLHFEVTVFLLGMDLIWKAVARGPALHRRLLISHPLP